MWKSIYLNDYIALDNGSSMNTFKIELGICSAHSQWTVNTMIFISQNVY